MADQGDGQHRAGPLTGVRVLDLSRVLAGPYAAMYLGDMGAEVIKIEQPGEGDETRTFGPPFVGGESAYFLSLNRNKRSITINLKHPDGKALFLDLVRRADVLIDNFKTGTLERMGLGDEALWDVNPRLIHAAVTGFGTEGPYAGYPGYDFVVQGLSGIMSVTGEPQGEPMKVGIAVVDVTAGLFTLSGVLAALYNRSVTGRGQRVDVSLLQAAMAWLLNVGQNYLVSGQEPARLGNGHPNIVPYQVFRAADRPMTVAPANPRQFARLAQALGHPELADDPRFRSNADRLQHRRELVEILQDIIATRPADEWVQLLNEAGVPAGSINTIPQAFADPQVQALGVVQTLPHPTAGELKLVGPPLRFSDTPVQARRAPPLLGADTETVLGELLGLDAARINDLRSEGAI